MIEELETRDISYMTVAWTGIAAILLPGGRTCYSAFSLPNDFEEIGIPKLTRSKRAQLHDTWVIIWDEAPMAPRIVLENS